MPIRVFPNLAISGFTKTSEADTSYNCFSWARGENESWCDVENNWPVGVPREHTLVRFEQVFKKDGYIRCNDGNAEDGFEKVAIYAASGDPRHAARQLPNGKWTSKLGKGMDIEHELDGLNGKLYGRVVRFLKRPL